MSLGRRVSIGVIAVLFVVAGVLHFATPGFYLRIMPAYLPWHYALVLVSGAAEVAGGLGVLVPRTRRAAGIGLIALLIAVFPANLEMALHPERFGFAPALLWARLPLQGALIAWVWWAAVRRSTRVRGT